MKVPDHLFERQSYLSVVFGVFAIIGALFIFSLGSNFFWIGLMNLMFGVCFISLGARKVVKIQEYFEWSISLRNPQPEVKEMKLNINQLKIELLKTILDIHKKEGFIDKGRLIDGNYGRNPYFMRCFGNFVGLGLIEEIRKNHYVIPPSKLDEVDKLIKSG